MTEGRITAWSFSRLEVFEKCPYRAYLKYVEKREEPASEKRDKALKRGRETHDLCEQYVRGEIENIPNELIKFEKAFKAKKMVFADGMGIVEEDWAYDNNWKQCEWYGSEAWLRVKLDWLEWHDAEHTSAHIVDYKTGRKDGNEVKHSQQGQLYVVAAFMRFTELQVVSFQMEYLDHGTKTIRRVYTRDEAMKFFPNFDERAREMTDAPSYPPRPNRMACKWCPYGPDNGDGSCEYGVEA